METFQEFVNYENSHLNGFTLLSFTITIYEPAAVISRIYLLKYLLIPHRVFQFVYAEQLEKI